MWKPSVGFSLDSPDSPPLLRSATLRSFPLLRPSFVLSSSRNPPWLSLRLLSLPPVIVNGFFLTCSCPCRAHEPPLSAGASMRPSRHISGAPRHRHTSTAAEHHGSRSRRRAQCRYSGHHPAIGTVTDSCRGNSRTSRLGRHSSRIILMPGLPIRYLLWCTPRMPRPALF